MAGLGTNGQLEIFISRLLYLCETYANLLHHHLPHFAVSVSSPFIIAWYVAGSVVSGTPSHLCASGKQRRMRCVRLIKVKGRCLLRRAASSSPARTFLSEDCPGFVSHDQGPLYASAYLHVTFAVQAFWQPMIIFSKSFLEACLAYFCRSAAVAASKSRTAMPISSVAASMALCISPSSLNRSGMRLSTLPDAWNPPNQKA